MTVALISSSDITDCFQKMNYQGFNLVVWNLELPVGFLHALASYLKHSLFYVKNKAF